MTLYDIPIARANGETTTLAEFRGLVLLIVNVASKCGFTGQYAGLQALQEKYGERGFQVLGFPCNQFLWQEPADDAAIQSFCSTNYKITFPVFAKLAVNGPQTHPLYQLLKSQQRGWLGTRSIKWNFTKFLVNRTGRVVARYGSTTSPEKLQPVIEVLLAESETAGSAAADPAGVAP